MLVVKSDSSHVDTTGLYKVGWSRGMGCQSLADRLGEEPGIRLDGDLQRACVTQRVDLLVARRLTSFDLVPVAVPFSIELDRVTAVTAAVGSGPHSDIAASAATRLAMSLDVAGELVTVYRADAERAFAQRRLDSIASAHRGLTYRLVRAESAEALVGTLSPTTLLVIGAPGGSWFQRQIYGPGHQLRVAAPCGAVVVRSAPRRCYHEMVDPAGSAVGPQLTVGDALRLIHHAAVPVAEAGKLIGILRRALLVDAPAYLTVADVMEPPVSVTAVEPLDAVDDLLALLDGGPIPVVDEAGYLVGAIPAGRDRVFDRGKEIA